MAFLNWDNAFSVKNAIIDSEHKQLITCINDLYEVSKNEISKDEVVENTLQNLIQYSIRHFSDEEDLMIKYEYPEFAKHKSYHDGFTKEILSFEREYFSGNTELSQKIFEFLKDWLINHILQVDKKLGEFLKDKN